MNKRIPRFRGATIAVVWLGIAIFCALAVALLSMTGQQSRDVFVQT